MSFLDENYSHGFFAISVFVFTCFIRVVFVSHDIV